MERKEECIKIYAETESSSLSKRRNIIPSLNFLNGKLHSIKFPIHTLHCQIKKQLKVHIYIYIITANHELRFLSFKLGY